MITTITRNASRILKRTRRIANAVCIRGRGKEDGGIRDES